MWKAPTPQACVADSAVTLLIRHLRVPCNLARQASPLTWFRSCRIRSEAVKQQPVRMWVAASLLWPTLRGHMRCVLVCPDPLATVVRQFGDAMVMSRRQGTAEMVETSGMRAPLAEVFTTSGAEFDTATTTLVDQAASMLTCEAIASAVEVAKDAACCDALYVV